MSKEISFSVSAKAARLIGRENITDVSGALTELVKNSYDADAESVLINYDIPFPIIEEGQDISENINVLSSRDFEFLKNEQCIKIYQMKIKQKLKQEKLKLKKKFTDIKLLMFLTFHKQICQKKNILKIIS